MKFNTHFNKKINKSSISCLDWVNNEEIYLVVNHNEICCWNSTSQESNEIAKLHEDFCATDIHWLTGKHSASAKGGGSESLLITSSDGRFVLLSRNARVERYVEAHKLAIVSGRWSPDGSSLLTASEDGSIKIWSRTGMLRSTVVQNQESILHARWSKTSNVIAFCQNEYIVVKPLAVNNKLIKWRAHKGLVLCISWSASGLIASGGEDNRYRIWDQQGANIFTSSSDSLLVTSVEFSLTSNLLLVGSFNVLKLCTEDGWTMSNSNFSDNCIGCINGICWSPDDTQIACKTSSGNLIVGYITDKKLCSRNLKATLTGGKSILLEDFISETTDILEFSERIINFELDYGHLIVATSKQVHVFNENYINTPIIIDGRYDVRIIKIGKKHFAFVDSTTIWIYTYTGKLYLNPRFPGSQVQCSSLTSSNISLGLDILAVRDAVDQTILYIFDLLPSGGGRNEAIPINLKTILIEVSVSRSGNSDNQCIAFIDSNRELYIIQAREEFKNQSIFKIGTQIISIIWSDETNILAGLHDGCFSVWYCPAEACIDPTLISITTVTFDLSEFIGNLKFYSFENEIVTLQSSGALLAVNINIYAIVLHKALMDGQWKKALKICRLDQNKVLWATLAAIALKQNQLEISEEAFCAALQIDKAYYLQYIKELPSGSLEYNAEISLMMGRIGEAKTIFLKNKKFSEAINLYVRTHNWEKAKKIAKEQNDASLLDEVLKEETAYLKALQTTRKD